MQDITLPIRNKKGQFSTFPLGALIQMVDEKTHVHKEVYFVVIGYYKGVLSCLPYTNDKTRLHQQNFKVSKGEQVRVLKNLTKKELKEWSGNIAVQIKSKKFPAYSGVATNAKFLIDNILLKYAHVRAVRELRKREKATLETLQGITAAKNKFMQDGDLESLNKALLSLRVGQVYA